MDLATKNFCFTKQKLQAKRTTLLGWNSIIIPVKAFFLADDRNTAYIAQNTFSFKKFYS